MKKIKRSIRLYRRYLMAVKLLKRLANQMTVALPCVNLCVSKRFGKRLAFFNNDDLIALLDIKEVLCMVSLGKLFCAGVLYCLCVKYSIDKFC